MYNSVFKGKRVDNEEWVEGFLFYQKEEVGYSFCIGTEPLSANDYSEILGEDVTWFHVIPETVRQFTGKELGNEKLYVGDIVEWHEDYDDYWGYPATSYGRAIVVYDESNYCFAVKSEDELFPFNDWEWSNCIVIGNIHDNPELMEVEENDL